MGITCSDGNCTFLTCELSGWDGWKVTFFLSWPELRLLGADPTSTALISHADVPESGSGSFCLFSLIDPALKETVSKTPE